MHRAKESLMKQLNADLKSGNLKQIYLLYGEERYLRRQYKNRLRDALCAPDDTMNVHFFEGKDIAVGEIIDLAETLPFLAERRVIFLTDSGLFKAGGEKLAEYLSSPNETTTFIFTESEVDKRSKLYKTVSSKGYAAEFAIQDEATLKRWIVGSLAKEEKKISEDTLQLFLLKVGTNMDNIQSELEKLIAYTSGKDVIAKEDVEAICSVQTSNHIFDMINAIADRDKKKALALYYDLLALKEPPMRILFLIARQCNLLLQAKDLSKRGLDNRTIAGKLGVPPFVAGKYLAQASKMKTSTLRNAVEQCVEAESSIKQGRMNDVMSVEILLFSVL